MAKKFFLTCSLIICYAMASFAMQADSSLSITSSKNEFEFILDKASGKIAIKQKLSDTYTSNAYQVNYPVTEFYNDHIRIDEALCKVDGHTPRDFKPVYTYYGGEDVFYSDEKVCYFPITLTKPGSTAVVTFEETLDDPRYFTNIFFAESLAVKYREVTLTIPRWMKVEIKELNFAGYNLKKNTQYLTDKDADVITYFISDLPAFNREPSSPGPTYLYPHLLVLCKSATVNGTQVTYFNTVADQYAWYHGLVKRTVNDDAVIGAKAREITAGLPDDMAKIKAIFYYVQNNIRYIAFEDGMAGFTPEKADEVLRKKYGDCKGMANLTKCLLTSLGFDARLGWLGTNHIAYDYQTPSLAVDNHMICGLNYKGKMFYLDATETYLGFNEYAERIQGRQVLIENGDSYLLNKIPYADPVQNSAGQVARLSVDGNSLVGKVSYIWKGENKEEVLSGINSVKHENTDEAMMKFLSGDNSDYTITNLVMSNTGNADIDLTATYDLNYKNAVNIFSKDLYIDLDTKKEFNDMAIKTDERKYDYWFSNKTNITTQAELTIPANYKPGNIPADLNIVNPDYEFHVSYVASPTKLIYKKSIVLKNTILLKTKFTQWNRDIEQLNKAYNQTIILKPIN